MADSWKAAKEEAERSGLPIVYHDLERKIYGACRREDDCGHFSCGRFVGHRAICMKADATAQEMEAKEATYIAEHPEFAEDPKR